MTSTQQTPGAQGADLLQALNSDPPLTPTQLALMAKHGPTVPLREVSKQYFNLSYREACRAASLNRLPVPTFRLTESLKAPVVVRASELAEFIDRQANKAAEQWTKTARPQCGTRSTR
jgi:hypothetical protein